MANTYLTDGLIPTCKKCGKKMVLDDIDYKFKGNQDEYWICETLEHDSAFVKVRYGNVCKIKYEVNNE